MPEQPDPINLSSNPMVNLGLTTESLERLSPQIERLLGAIERLHLVDVTDIEPDFLTPYKEQ